MHPFLVAGGWGTKEKKHFRATGDIWVWPQCQLEVKAIGKLASLLFFKLPRLAALNLATLEIPRKLIY